jgi:hypothetical protein
MFRKPRGRTCPSTPRASIGDACARLASTEQPIVHIADAVGYGTFANFNRQFKLLTSMTPREYRAHFRSQAYLFAYVLLDAESHQLPHGDEITTVDRLFVHHAREPFEEGLVELDDAVDQLAPLK